MMASRRRTARGTATAGAMTPAREEDEEDPALGETQMRLVSWMALM
jgi:hypothetical protein